MARKAAVLKGTPPIRVAAKLAKPPTPTTALEQQGDQLRVRALEVRVTSLESFQFAASLVQMIKLYEQEVDKLTSPVVKAAHAAHQAALAQRKTLLQPAMQAEQHLKLQLDTYEAERQRMAREAAAAQERERLRLEEAERQRVALEEAKRLEEAEQQKAAQVQQALAVGDAIRAGRIASTPVEIVPVPMQPVFVPPVQVEIPTADGVQFKPTYKAKVISLGLLIRAVAEGRAPIAALQADEVFLNQMARAMREKFEMPGVEAVEVRVVAVTP